MNSLCATLTKHYFTCEETKLCKLCLLSISLGSFLILTNHRNYEQLGLKFKLFSAEVLFNHGLALIYMGRVDEGLADMQEARAQKATDEHNVIDDAIADRGEGYTVFSIVS